MQLWDRGSGKKRVEEDLGLLGINFKKIYGVLEANRRLGLKPSAVTFKDLYNRLHLVE